MLSLALLASIASAREPVPVAHITLVSSRVPETVVLPIAGGWGGDPEASAAAIREEVSTAAQGALQRAFLDRLLPEDRGHVSVVAYRLRDGRGVSLEPDRSFYAASTFKLAVLYALEQAAFRGSIDMDASLTISAADAAEDLGTLGSLPLAPDGSLPIRAAARAMVTLSDNSTAVALLHRLGAANINADLRALGITTFDVNTTELPVDAADLARLMEAVVRGEGVGPDQRAEMREFLLGQQTREGIPSGLPANVLSGNKTGTWPGITHDVAFVDAPGGTYVVAILTDQGWNWARVARISQTLYELFANDAVAVMR